MCVFVKTCWSVEGHFFQNKNKTNQPTNQPINQPAVTTNTLTKAVCIDIIMFQYDNTSDTVVIHPSVRT